MPQQPMLFSTADPACQLTSSLPHTVTLVKHHPTMRYIHKDLATQYDPLRFSIPFTTRVKGLVQRLWTRPRDWDDPNIPADLLEKWNVWEKELPDLCKLRLPRCNPPVDFDVQESRLSLHVFGDASEVAYGSVAYLRAEQHGKIHTAFVMARSRVAPKRQLSMPHLELCAALTSAQLTLFLKQELSVTDCVIHLTSHTKANRRRA